MPAVRYPVRYPTRYRQVPHGPDAFKALHTECASLLDRNAPNSPSYASSCCPASTPRTSSTDSAAPAATAPLPSHPSPATPNHSQENACTAPHCTALAVLARNARPMTLVEIHRELHLNGYAIASRNPVKQLANSLGYEDIKGRARRVERAVSMRSTY